LVSYGGSGKNSRNIGNTPFLILRAAEIGTWTSRQRDNDGKPLERPESLSELELVKQCKEFHMLPRAGGLLDQPAGLMEKLSAIYSVWQAHYNFAHTKDVAEFMTNNQSDWEIIQKVKELKHDKK
jgi:hypothetical protein